MAFYIFHRLLNIDCQSTFTFNFGTWLRRHSSFRSPKAASIHEMRVRVPSRKSNALPVSGPESHQHPRLEPPLPRPNRHRKVRDLPLGQQPPSGALYEGLSPRSDGPRRADAVHAARQDCHGLREALEGAGMLLPNRGMLRQPEVEVAWVVASWCSAGLLRLPWWRSSGPSRWTWCGFQSPEGGLQAEQR